MERKITGFGEVTSVAVPGSPPTNNQVMLKLLQLVYNPPPLETVTACAIPCGTVTW